MAMAIVVVGMVGLMQAVTIGTETLDTNRKQQVALRMVETELDRLRGGDWNTIATLPASATISINPAGAISGDTLYFALSNGTPTPADDDTTLSSLARGFSCVLKATRMRPTGATASTVTFVKLEYTVTWNSSGGRRHSRRIETYLGKNGLHLSHQQS